MRLSSSIRINPFLGRIACEQVYTRIWFVYVGVALYAHSVVFMRIYCIAIDKHATFEHFACRRVATLYPHPIPPLSHRTLRKAHKSAGN